jgi:pimeloyl-ACP methyl ester carboxylesterase
MAASRSYAERCGKRTTAVSGTGLLRRMNHGPFLVSPTTQSLNQIRKCVEWCGHFPMIDDPALVARAILAFIDTVDRRLGLTPQPSGEIP